jgi:hypothetical protein
MQRFVIKAAGTPAELICTQTKASRVSATAAGRESHRSRRAELTDGDIAFIWRNRRGSRQTAETNENIKIAVNDC